MKKYILLLLFLLASTPVLAQSGTSVGPFPPCSAFGTTAGTCVQGNDSRITNALQVGPAWKMYLASGGPTSISGSTLVPFDTDSYDPATICSTGAAAKCIPNVAGTYAVSCGALIDATTGPALEGALGVIAVKLNGSSLTVGGSAEVIAQVASLSSPVVLVSTADTLVTVNGSTDAIACYANSSSTGAAIQNTGGTFMFGHFVHP